MTFVSGYSLSEDYASHLQRIGAFAIDLVIITVASAILAWAGTYLRGEDDPVTGPLLSAFQLLMPWFYYAVMEGSAKGATIGKMVLDIRVVDADGHPPYFRARRPPGHPQVPPVSLAGLPCRGLHPAQAGLPRSYRKDAGGQK